MWTTSVTTSIILLQTAFGATNPNCESRGKCIEVGPGTKYPEQNTLCLADVSATGPWHCANFQGVWGSGTHTFGPSNTMDLTMLGGSPLHPMPPGTPDLNETFTVHATTDMTYGKCADIGATQWSVTRELTYLNGTADGTCRTRLLEGTRELGDFEHKCGVLAQFELAADEKGAATCVGCRCCSSCKGCACLPP
jgi:hypothetical protein